MAGSAAVGDPPGPAAGDGDAGAGEGLSMAGSAAVGDPPGPAAGDGDAGAGEGLLMAGSPGDELVLSPFKVPLTSTTGIGAAVRSAADPTLQHCRNRGVRDGRLCGCRCIDL